MKSAGHLLVTCLISLKNSGLKTRESPMKKHHLMTAGNSGRSRTRQKDKNQ
ncbi:MAG: hypothetical protein MI863_14230 [Desulfobacterales bacterium]|nr:hypothetical protein [Desulfobacterales bacterium]